MINTVKNKCVFLDKDGTLIKDIPFNVNVSLIEILDGVKEGLELLRSHGFLLVVVSNQHGIALGYFDSGALEQVKQHLFNVCTESGTDLDAFYYCPHAPNDGCDCRKPGTGMLLNAARDLNIDLGRSWMIGDILNDVEAGNRAGCRTVLIDNGNETEWLSGKFREPEFKAANLIEASKYIVAEDKRRKNETKLERQEECIVHPTR